MLRLPDDSPVIRRIRHAWRVLSAASVWCAMASAAVAQDAAAPPSGGGTTIVVSGRTLYVEVALLLAMFGAVLFAVCRSSRRN